MTTRPVHTARDRVLVRQSVALGGEVQGLGIRPTVARLARSLNLRGSVRNGPDGVAIELVGESASIDAFLAALPPAVSTELELTVGRPGEPGDVPDSFFIEPSLERGPLRTRVPLDRRVCEACLREMDCPSDRRYGYPFISCTCCGPRYSILEAMPYDRQRTSMGRFSMCDRCRAEYEDPADRRFHAQTNCCPECGPRWWSVEHPFGQREEGNAALAQTANVILAGGIVAIKGLGGYQLVCDATDPQAIERLRAAKQRPRKPMAIMVDNIEQATAIASLSSLERASLCSEAGPIVLARARDDSAFSDVLMRFVHPGLCEIGLMLPTTPLHHWLCGRVGKPLIVTSANREGEPLAYRESEAADQLSAIADLQLHHDREIVRPIDDAVVRCLAGRMVTLRAGRGLAPIRLNVPQSSDRAASNVPEQAVWATGGQQKVAIALWNGHQAVLGPHLGEMTHPAARDRFLQQSRALFQLYHCEPNLISHDLHPDYFSTRHAQQQTNDMFAAAAPAGTTRQATASQGPMAIQHHHAHVVTGMIEAGWTDREVLGIAMDGTGYGIDGTIWGGEILVASRSRFERVAHLRPFPLPGGEASIREPFRTAIAVVADAIGMETLRDGHPFPLDFPQASQVLQILSRPQWSPTTTSVGRLFDAVAAILLHQTHCSFEGELAMQLESICNSSDRAEYTMAVSTDRPVQLDWRPMIRQILSDRDQGVPRGASAMRFHRGLARAIVAVAEQFPDLPVILSGGVFQNRVLMDLIVDLFPRDRELGLPGQLPPNDGGLAAGQLVAMLSVLPRSQTCV